MVARVLHQLTDRFCKSAPPGRHCDGGGLYLNVSDNGARSWLFFWKVDGTRHAISLGRYPDVPLATVEPRNQGDERIKGARDLAADARRKIGEARRIEGGDPVGALKTGGTASRTFGDCVQEYIKDHEGAW